MNKKIGIIFLFIIFLIFILLFLSYDEKIDIQINNKIEKIKQKEFSEDINFEENNNSILEAKSSKINIIEKNISIMKTENVDINLSKEDRISKEVNLLMNENIEYETMKIFKQIEKDISEL
jgi:hypothetical protein